MATAKQLVKSLRQRHGLSQAALAERAGCPSSTIGRIETNKLDPTLTMLQRLFAACGERFPSRPVAEAAVPSLATLAGTTRSIDTVPWTELRGLIDWLGRHPDDTEDVLREPAPRRDDAVANLFAAIAEKLADDHNLPRPEWTAAVPPLATAWRPHGTPRMQAREAATAPAQFRARNLFMSAANPLAPHAGGIVTDAFLFTRTPFAKRSSDSTRS